MKTIHVISKIHIRYNKSAGQPGRGSPEHIWRVFVNGEEYLVKHFHIYGGFLYDEQTGPDWNLTCVGTIEFGFDGNVAIVKAVNFDGSINK